MAERVQLVLVIHNHQPVGNFDHVIHEACDQAYLPFLRAALDAPHVRFGLHTSGCLLEWLESHRIEYFELVRELLSRGQIELLGGGMYEPILPVLPNLDCHRQLAMMKEYISEHFSVEPTGMWLPERVWEPHLARWIGPIYRYTLLDDYHFLGNALPELVPTEYFNTEFEVTPLKLLPISQELRYTIPFQPPLATIEHLRSAAASYPRPGQPLVVFGDDGEKFGVWPETYEWVYQRGWLKEFFGALADNKDMIHICLPGEVVNQREAAAQVYIPCRSYKEMGEWSRLGALDSSECPPGHWRNYLVKYPESGDFYRRMQGVSERLFSPGSCLGECYPEEASVDILRAQCNCAYWHGVFGGLYLNYLRAALTRCLLSAERDYYAAIDQWAAKTPQSRRERMPLVPLPFTGSRLRLLDDYGTEEEWHSRTEEREEARHSTLSILSHSDWVLEQSGHQFAWFDAACGLCLRRLDYYPTLFCWTDVLARRREHYHHKLEELAARGEEQEGEEHASIHDRVVVKEPGLEQRLVVDPHQRVSFVTYFSDVADPAWFMRVPDTTAVQPRFSFRDFELPAKAVETAAGISAYFEQPGFVLHKSAGLQAGGLDLGLRALRGLPPAGAGLFWVEFNLTVLTCNADDRYMQVDGVRKSLAEPLGVDAVGAVALADEWQRRRAVLSCLSGPAHLLSYPVFTVSSSEGGFERTYQGTCIMLGYAAQALADGIRLRLAIEELG